MEGQPHRRAVVTDDLEGVHDRPAGGHLDLDPAPGELVGPLAADLHRRRRRDDQVDRAAQALERRLELGPFRSRVAFERLALGIPGRRGRRQVDVREVPLVE